MVEEKKLLVEKVGKKRSECNCGREGQKKEKKRKRRNKASE